MSATAAALELSPPRPSPATPDRGVRCHLACTSPKDLRPNWMRTLSTATPSRPLGAAERSREQPGSRLTDLPWGPLEVILMLLVGSGRSCGNIRRTCRSLRNAFDACNTRLAFAGAVPPPPASALYLPRRKVFAPRRTAGALLPVLLRLVRSSPRVSSLTLSGDVGLDWGKALQAAGPVLCAGLRQLRLLNMHDLIDLSPLSSLAGLQDLDLTGASSLEQLSPLAACTRLRRLDLSRTAVRDLSPLAVLAVRGGGLQHVILHGCRMLEQLAPLAVCSALTALDLSRCRALHQLAPLAWHRSLLRLRLSSCVELDDLGALSACISLQHLELASCASLHDVSPLAACSSLLALDINKCTGITALSALSALPSLHSLHCHSMRAELLPHLASLSSLHQLDLSSSDLQDLWPLTALRRLRHLNLSHCSLLVNIDALSSFASSLACLNLSYCANLRALAPLRRCSALTHLDLSGACDIDLSTLRTLRGLQHLSLSNSVQHTRHERDLELLTGCASLRTLNLSACCWVRDFSPLQQCAALRKLYLSRGCEATGLAYLTSAAPAVELVWDM